MPISIEADPTLAQGYIKVNGTTAATLTASGIVSGGVPAGAVLPFAMNTAPAGWLAADGDEVSRTDYAALFSAVGTTYGAGDGSTTFALPDLRGYFVRGSGTNGDGTAAGTFGAKQPDALQGHHHQLGTTAATVRSTQAGSSNATAAATATQGLLVDRAGAVIADGTNGTPRTASETRPANIAMLYCIKF
jgi:microcystin-dependent protein